MNPHRCCNPFLLPAVNFVGLLGRGQSARACPNNTEKLFNEVNYTQTLNGLRRPNWPGPVSFLSVQAYTSVLG
jgi:hypothetical protein